MENDSSNILIFILLFVFYWRVMSFIRKVEGKLSATYSEIAQINARVNNGRVTLDEEAQRSLRIIADATRKLQSRLAPVQIDSP